MGEIERSRADIIDTITANGIRRELASQYADAYLEYREASNNLEANGTMVLHPRTASPIENPYLKIRDRALQKLQKMREVRADFLW